MKRFLSRILIAGIIAAGVISCSGATKSAAVDKVRKLAYPTADIYGYFAFVEEYLDEQREKNLPMECLGDGDADEIELYYLFAENFLRSHSLELAKFDSNDYSRMIREYIPEELPAASNENYYGLYDNVLDGLKEIGWSQTEFEHDIVSKSDYYVNNTNTIMQSFESEYAAWLNDRVEVVECLPNEKSSGATYTGYLVIYKVKTQEYGDMYVLIDMLEYDDESSREASVIALDLSLININRYIER